MGFLGFFADLKQLIMEWAWIILAVTAAAGFSVSFSAGVLPFPTLRAYAKGIHILAIVAAIFAGVIYGKASSSAHHRLAEAKRLLNEEKLRRAMLERVISNRNASIERTAAANERLQKFNTELSNMVTADVEKNAEEQAADQNAKLCAGYIAPWSASDQRRRAARLRRAVGQPQR